MTCMEGWDKRRIYGGVFVHLHTRTACSGQHASWGARYGWASTRKASKGTESTKAPRRT
jgi:hypothetical protein